jgi:2-hydroxychromene-2-carboxylate isomerase
MAKPTIEFWYEFASTYSYLAASRVQVEAARHGVSVRWRPFLLGPLFKAQANWNTSPFELYEEKGRNMWRDFDREAAGLRLPPITRPNPFPAHSLLAARVATLASSKEAPWLVPFSKAVYKAEWAEGKAIGDKSTISAILKELGLDPEATIEEASSDANKSLLKCNVEEAGAKGIYGAPTFITADGELFWGNDRMERAMMWAKGERHGF